MKLSAEPIKLVVEASTRAPVGTLYLWDMERQEPDGSVIVSEI
ncbi:MAG: hypothetical protein WBA25_17850 [Jannaschia sp.]